jgi:type IV pilus assembly protein PilV
MKRSLQQGFFLLEALIAILIFSLGILGMVAMGGAAITATADAQSRTDAARLADEIASKISLNVDRTSVATIAASLDPFQHQPGGANCAFTGNASANNMVLNWVDEVRTVGPGLPGLPGASATSQQIRIDTTAAGGFNRVSVTICWQAPSDKAVRQHTLVTYIN